MTEYLGNNIRRRQIYRIVGIGSIFGIILVVAIMFYVGLKIAGFKNDDIYSLGFLSIPIARGERYGDVSSFKPQIGLVAIFALPSLIFLTIFKIRILFRKS